MAVPVTSISLRLQDKPDVSFGVPIGVAARDALPGFITFPGTAGNYLTVPITTPVDASADWRVECVRPPIPPSNGHEATSTPTWLRFTTAGIQSFIIATDATFPLATVTYTALNAGVGFPAVGQRVQLRGTWDPATDTIALLWRPAGPDLDDDDGWFLAASTVAAGKQLRTSDVVWNLTGPSATFPMVGDVYRWLRRINGVTTVDVNPAVDVDDIDAATFTATSGQTVTVNRSGSPATTLGTPGDEWRLVIEQLVGTGAVWGTFKWSDGTKWGALAWTDLTPDWRGMEWGRGSDQPFGRPRAGEIVLTLDARSFDAPGERRYAPVNQPRRTRPGVIIRAGLVSATDPRAGGWIPLWTGVVDSWVLNTEQDADFFAEVRLVETLSTLSRVNENALPGFVGADDTPTQRFERLLDAARWKFGFVRRSWSPDDFNIPLQTTDMAKPRLDELYLTADSSAYIIRSDRTGAALMTDTQKFTLTAPNLLADFSHSLAGNQLIRFHQDGEALDFPTKAILYDRDSLEVAQDPEHIVNDHRYARAGGTQQVVEHTVSVGRFGRSTRARSDLICQFDVSVAGIAGDDNDREALSSMRIDAVTFTATGKGEYYLLVAAIDIGSEAICVVEFIDTGEDRFIEGPVRSMVHTVTPMKGRVHWTATFALDTRVLAHFPVGTQLDPLP